MTRSIAAIHRDAFIRTGKHYMARHFPRGLPYDFPANDNASAGAA